MLSDFFQKSLQNRFTAILLSVALIPLLIVALISYQQAKQALETAALREVALSNQVTAQEIENFLNQFKSDLLSLSQMPTIQAIIRASDNDGVDPQSHETIEVWTERLNQIFVPFAENKQFYQQVRYLDENGQEIVRVDFRNKKILVIPKEELQDKKGRYYFSDTMVLGNEDIYISALDLNRERGEIEVPHVPVIRFGTPVFDEAGNKRGMVILNVYANSFLHILDLEEKNFYLANDEGYYLHHSDDPQQEFGFDLGTDFNVKQDFAWGIEQIGDRESYVGNDTSAGQVVALDRIRFDSDKPERFWMLVSRLPEDVVLGDINALATIIAGVVVAVVVIVSTVAVQVVKSITAPISELAKVSQEIAKGNWNASLEVTSSDEIGRLADSFRQMISQLRYSMQSLQESEERHRSISELTTDYIYRFTVTGDNKFIFDWVSDAFTHVTGYTLAELVLRGGWMTLIHPDDQPLFLEWQRRLLNSDRPLAGEYRIITKDEEIRWLHDHWRPPRNGQESVVRILGAATDITERKKAEISLRETQQLLAKQNRILEQRRVELTQAHQEITDLSKRLKVEALRLGAELEESRQLTVEPSEQALDELVPRQSSELDLIRQLQLMLLPTAAELRQIKGVEFAGEPAGNYYDQLLQYGELHIGISQSRVLMLMTEAVIRILLIGDESEQSRFLNLFNGSIDDHLQTGPLSLALLDYQVSERLELRGQHLQMIVVHSGGEVTIVDSYDLGFPPIPTDLEAPVQLRPIEGIILYTSDSKESDSQYVLEQLRPLITKHWQESAESIKAAVIADMHKAKHKGRVPANFSLLVLKQK